MLEREADQLVREALGRIRELKAEVARLKGATSPVAITGVGVEMAGGVTSLDDLWNAMVSGADHFCDPPHDRWADRVPDGVYTTRAAYVQPSQFDPSIFGMSPRESKALDPQQKLLLKTTWWALEDAGVSLDEVSASQTGVYVALSSDDFAQRIGASLGELDSHRALGSARSMAAGRLGYFLNAHGPAICIDTACSSSLVALHMATQDLRSGRIDRAVVTGANLILDPSSTLAFCKLGALSPTGLCRSFDVGGDGYVRGEGAIALVLEREADAVAAGRTVHSSIVGSAIGHDGQSNGLTAPNGRSQEMVIRRAISDAGITVDDIDYVEAHATGTVLGDPIELQALDRVMAGRTKGSPVHVGSIKSCFGHLEAAAGLASVLRTSEVLRRGAIPPQVNFTEPNDRFKWKDSRLAVPSAQVLHGQFDRAGVSSFGMSGTNAHVVLRAPRRTHETSPADWKSRYVTRLSAPTRASLQVQVDKLKRIFDSDTSTPSSRHGLGAPGSKATPYRVAVQAGTAEEMRRRLDRVMPQVRPAHSSAGVIAAYGGQGSLPVPDGPLEAAFPAYRRRMETARTVFEDLANMPFTVTAEPTTANHFRQVATTAHQLAVADVLSECGLQPQLSVGYSLGEYAAAVGAGVFSAEDALHLITKRAMLCAEMSPDSRLVLIDGPADELAAVIDEHDLPTAIVISETRKIVSTSGIAHDRLVEQLRQAPLRVWPLDVASPFHTAEMQDVASAFESVVRGVTMRPATGAVHGGVPGRVMWESQYWIDHLIETFRFDRVLEAIGEKSGALLVEVGGPTTVGPLATSAQVIGRSDFVPTISQGGEPDSDLRTAIARLFTSGAITRIETALGIGLRATQRYEFSAEPLIQSTEKPREGNGAPAFSSSDDGPAHNWSLEFDPQDSMVGDHVILNSTVIAAAYQLRLYRDFAVSLGVPSCALLNVEFRAPITVEGASARVQLQSQRDPSGPTVLEIVGPGGVLHSRCTLEPWTGTPGARVPVSGSPDEEVDPAQLYARMSASGYHLGDGYRRLQELHSLGQQRAHGIVDDEPGRFSGLQPGTLDSALQVLAVAASGFDGAEVAPSIPFFIERIEFSKDLVSSNHHYEVDALVTSFDAAMGSLAGDLQVHDDTGRRVVRVAGVHARSVGVPAEDNSALCTLDVSWDEHDRGEQSTVVRGQLIIMGAGDGPRPTSPVARKLPWPSAEDDDMRSAAERIAADLVDTICGTEGEITVVFQPDDGIATQDKARMWTVMRAVASLNGADLARTRWVIATQGGALRGGFVGSPLGSALAAFFRSAALEIPEVDWVMIHAARSVDLAVESVPTDARMIWLDGRTTRIANLLVQPAVGTKSLVAAVVMGASGTIGRAVMEHCSSAVGVMRSGSVTCQGNRQRLLLPDRAEGWPAFISELGHLVQPDEVLVHVAGVSADSSLGSLKWELFDQAWDSKVPLAVALAACEAPVVIATTVAALLGSPGQSAYAAVNGYVEGIAGRGGDNARMRCVALGPVAGSPMVGRASQRATSWARAGLSLMTAQAASDALLSTNSSAVAQADPDAVRSAFANFGRVLVSPGSAGVEKVDLLEYPSAERRPTVAGMLADQLAVLLHLNGAEIDWERRLLDLGVDSLIALEVRSWLQSRFGVSLDVEAMFNDATVNSVGAAVVSALERSGDESDEVLL